MPTHSPLVAVILQTDEDDIAYQLYGQAYGIEMQVDDEWEAELVLLAPHTHLTCVTEDTDVTGEDAAIVSAGVTDLPLDPEGRPNTAVISDAQNNWLIVGHRDDSDDMVRSKRDAALSAGGRVIICLASSDPVQVATRLNGVQEADLARVVVALLQPNAASPDALADAANAARSHFPQSDVPTPRVIVAGDISAENADDLLAIDGVDGFLMLPDQFMDFGDILELLETVGE